MGCAKILLSKFHHLKKKTNANVFRFFHRVKDSERLSLWKFWNNFFKKKFLPFNSKNNFHKKLSIHLKLLRILSPLTNDQILFIYLLFQKSFIKIEGKWLFASKIMRFTPQDLDSDETKNFFRSWIFTQFSYLHNFK